MQPPSFWRNPRHAPGLAARLLHPAALVWTAATARRVARAPRLVADVPVICVGNLTVGGTGKTPTVTALLERLADRNPHALSRGYGGSDRGPTRVDIARHSAAEVGDEPLLLAAFAPTWVARDRAAGARAAQDAGAGVIVMDDGLQNADLAKSLSIVVIDAETGFGNGRVMPAGPLREPVATGLARADLLVTIGPGAAQERLAHDWPELSDLPRLTGWLAPLRTGIDWRGQRVLAFAGIGRPQKFFATVAATGADIVATRSFADHAAYPRLMVERLMREAAAARAQLVTTEKDAVRLPPDLRRQVLVLPVRLAADDWSPLDRALARI